MVKPERDKRLQDLQVHEVGMGTANLTLHAPNWLELGVQLNMDDADPAVKTLERGDIHPDVRAGFETGQLTVRSLGELAVRPDIIDITTASGAHVDAIEQVINELELDKGGEQPLWLIEKPVVSSPYESRRIRELLEAKHILPEKTFVNEQYLASKALELLLAKIATEEGQGNAVQHIDVVFSKNRLPDVAAGRFRDAELGPYGIEMPHQLAIALKLANVNPMYADMIIEYNRFDSGVHGIPYSEGNYTQLTVNNISIDLAQGLGPYNINAEGEITPLASSAKPVERYAQVYFKNGATGRIDFDPVPQLPPRHSKVTLHNPRGEMIKETVLEDRSLKTVLGGVARYAALGTRPHFTSGLSIHHALAYQTLLKQLAQDAGLGSNTH